MTDCFNPEPIMLRNPTSLLVTEEKIQEEQMIEIAQHLAPEQFQYEFPPKSRIMAIEAEVDNDEFSYFDECSFTTTSTSTAAYSNLTYGQDDEEDDTDYYHQLMSSSNRSSSDRLDRYFESFTNEHGGNIFVSDNQLSPLQLPSQMSYTMRHIREESCDSTGTVVLRKPSSSGYSRPSSFLSESEHHHYLGRVAEEDRINWDETSFVFPDQSSHYVHENVYRSVHPYRLDSESDIFRNDDLASISEDDEGSRFSSNSKVIVMKISKNHPPTVIHCSGGSFISTTDEGYDDEEFEGDLKELPIESASVFLPLSDNEQDLLMDLEAVRQSAAVKIQSLWRGYKSRKQQSNCSLKLSNRVLAGLARVNDSIYRRNNNQLQDRCYELEQRLGEETAMRTAFEKAMEDMTILMDHQHKVLHERVEQEVDMRQAYERKMEQVMKQVQPLEARVRHEAKARADMESMMSRVLDQLHDIKVQQKEEVEQRNSLQRKLDAAMEEISLLKKQSTTKTNSTVRPSTTRPGVTTAKPINATQQRSVSRLSSTSTSSRNSTPARTTTPTGTRPAIRSTTLSKLSNRSNTPVASNDINKRSTTITTTPLRKTVINRKL
ncbi:unnamed protein product [Mucor hiemalis]